MGACVKLWFGLAIAQAGVGDGAEVTTVHPVVFVESERQGEAYEAFRRIQDDRPLELRLTGPGRVFVSVRTLIGSRRGEHQLSIELDGEAIQTAELTPSPDAKARFVEPVGVFRPGERRTFLVPIEAPEDAYPVRVTVWLTKGKEILVSPRFAPPFDLGFEGESSSSRTSSVAP